VKDLLDSYILQDISVSRCFLLVANLHFHSMSVVFAIQCRCVDSFNYIALLSFQHVISVIRELCWSMFCRSCYI